MSGRSSSPGTLGGNAAREMLAQEKLKKDMEEVRRILNSHSAREMGIGASVPRLHTRESIIANAMANPKGGRRRKSLRKSRKNRKSLRKSRN